MEREMKPVARGLFEAFRRFHRLNWKQSPVDGLKPSEILVLFCIKNKLQHGSPGIKVSEISGILKVAAPTVTQLVNGLEVNGFVERRMDKADRRAVRIKLTDAGERVLVQASAAFRDLFDGLVEFLGEEESIKLTELLSKVFIYFEEKRKPDLTD